MKEAMNHKWEFQSQLCEHCHTRESDAREHIGDWDECPGPMPDEPDWQYVRGEWCDLEQLLCHLMEYCDWQPPGATDEDKRADALEKAAYGRLLGFVAAAQAAQLTSIVRGDARRCKCGAGQRAPERDQHAGWCPLYR